MKIRPLRAELFNANGQTDTTNLIVAFRNFSYSPKNKNEIRGACGTHGIKGKYRNIL